MRGKWRLLLGIGNETNVKKILLLVLSLVLITSLVITGCVALEAPAPAPTPEAPPKMGVSVEQIKADLIGHIVFTSNEKTWTFAALSEFEQFDIRDEQRQGDIIEYDVSMRLVDLNTQQHYLMDALIVYRQSNGAFQLISIVPTLYTRLYK